MAIPEGFNLRKLFGQYFDMIRRTGSEHAEDIIELVEQRRAMKRCDVCGNAPVLRQPFTTYS